MGDAFGAEKRVEGADEERKMRSRAMETVEAKTRRARVLGFCLDL